jgi:hypothetical protein
VSGQLHAQAALLSGKRPTVPIAQEAGCVSSAGLDAVEKWEIYYSCREPNPDSAIIQPLARRYTNWAIPKFTYWNSARRYTNWAIPKFTYWNSVEHHCYETQNVESSQLMMVMLQMEITMEYLEYNLDVLHNKVDWKFITWIHKLIELIETSVRSSPSFLS